MTQPHGHPHAHGDAASIPPGEIEPILDRIRAQGGRVTDARVAIIEVLLAGPHHATVEDLKQRVQSVAPEIHEATFYRTLSALEALGVVYHLHLDHGPSVWHLATEDHEHLVCRNCGSITEISSSEFDAVRASIAERYGFELETHHFVTQGLCRDCRGT